MAAPALKAWVEVCERGVPSTVPGYMGMFHLKTAGYSGLPAEQLLVAINRLDNRYLLDRASLSRSSSSVL